MKRIALFVIVAVGLALGAGAVALQLDCRGIGRDACRSRRVLALPPDDLTVLVREVEAIEDPLLRGATLLAWTDAHRGRISMNDTAFVCSPLPPQEVVWCRRHLGSSHLAR